MRCHQWGDSSIPGHSGLLLGQLDPLQHPGRVYLRGQHQNLPLQLAKGELSGHGDHGRHGQRRLHHPSLPPSALLQRLCRVAIFAALLLGA